MTNKRYWVMVIAVMTLSAFSISLSRKVVLKTDFALCEMFIERLKRALVLCQLNDLVLDGVKV